MVHLLIWSSANPQNYLGAWSFRDGAHISHFRPHPHNVKNAARVQTNLKVTFLVKYLHYNVDIRQCCPKLGSKILATNEKTPEPEKKHLQDCPDLVVASQYNWYKWKVTRRLHVFRFQDVCYLSASLEVREIGTLWRLLVSCFQSFVIF